MPDCDSAEEERGARVAEDPIDLDDSSSVEAVPAAEAAHGHGAEGGAAGARGAAVAPAQRVVLQFLEAAVHQVIRARGVYPEELFERRQLFNAAVYMSRHAGLNSYI